jgi:hypothetical protein
MDNSRVVDISVYEEERELWGWPIPDQKRVGINEHQSKSVSSKAEDYDDKSGNSMNPEMHWEKAETLSGIALR